MTAVQPRQLTDREWKVAQGIAHRTPIPVIADQLGITDHAVIKARIRIFAKLGIHNESDFQKWYAEMTGEDLTPKVQVLKVRNPRRPRIDATTKITSKGQITLPKALRDHFGLKPGHEVEFIEDEDGKIYIRRHADPKRFEKWIGYLARTNPIDMTVDEYIDEIRGH